MSTTLDLDTGTHDLVLAAANVVEYGKEQGLHACCAIITSMLGWDGGDWYADGLSEARTVVDDLVTYTPELLARVYQAEVDFDPGPLLEVAAAIRDQAHRDAADEALDAILEARRETMAGDAVDAEVEDWDSDDVDNHQQFVQAMADAAAAVAAAYGLSIELAA